MLNPIDEFLVAFSPQPRANAPEIYAAMLSVALKQPDQIGTLLRAVLKQLPRGGTFFDNAISYLPAKEFSALASEAIHRLNGGDHSEAVESFLA